MQEELLFDTVNQPLFRNFTKKQSNFILLNESKIFISLYNKSMYFNLMYYLIYFYAMYIILITFLKISHTQFMYI